MLLKSFDSITILYIQWFYLSSFAEKALIWSIYAKFSLFCDNIWQQEAMCGVNDFFTFQNFSEVSLNLPSRKLVWRPTIFRQATKSLVPILESHPSSVHLISRTRPNKVSRQLIDTLVIWKISPVSEVTVPLRPEAFHARFPVFFLITLTVIKNINEVLR